MTPVSIPGYKLNQIYIYDFLFFKLYDGGSGLRLNVAPDQKTVIVRMASDASWCLVMVVPQFCLQFVIVVFPGHIFLLFFCDTCRW